MQTEPNPLRARRLLVAGSCAVVVPVALIYGYDFGSRLNGMLLGLATAANTAVLAALLVDQLVDLVMDRLLPRLRTVSRSEGGRSQTLPRQG